MRARLSVPAANDRDPLYMEQALAAIHQANPHHEAITLEFVRFGPSVGLAIDYPASLKAIVEGQLAAHYPECRLDEAEEENPPASAGEWISDVRLWPDLFPIRRYSQFEDVMHRMTADPLASLLSTIATSRQSHLECRIEIRLTPARHSARARARYCLKIVATPFLRSHHGLSRLFLRAARSASRPIRLLGWLASRVIRHQSINDHHAADSAPSGRTHDREEEVQAAGDKLGRHLFETHIRLTVRAPAAQAISAEAKLREMAGSFGLFTSPRLAMFEMGRIHRIRAELPPPAFAPFLLSTEEVATLWHPPTITVQTPTLHRIESREFEPPLALMDESEGTGSAILGLTVFRSRRERFGIRPDDRLRHLAILGKTGMGKSTLLFNLIHSDIADGRGCALIDPHGDLADALLASFPSHRTNDAVLFDAGDRSRPLAFNPLACRDPSRRHLVASAVLTSFKKLYGESWGPRLEHILRNALLALVEIPGTSLVSVLRLLSDARWRQGILSRVSDPIVRSFWEGEFARMPPKFQAEAIAPIQNKIGHFASSPILRGIIGQSENRFDLRAIMDAGKVLIVNLSKGRIGDDASSLLGSLLVTSVQLAAMGRADMPEANRKPFYLYVDEFQNFATESFATTLSEARKYGLGLVLANQYLDQMDERTRAAVFGNVGSTLVFQMGATDADFLTEQLGGGITAEDLMFLPRYRAYARLLIDGQPSRPFSMRTLPPSTRKIDPRRAEIIRRTSRQRYNTSPLPIHRQPELA
jgi:hypothetical protein